ncbi:hypothetical protein F2Q68_00043285 [Brassica cretica]|uniref:Uncharacterized protein n=1 Tax=Brassica cretica TaxID=69181 RepID=A0A8S9LMT4_BRACR|nr:hypothetical protein F2Q68_00043285 [Brassica cretica]
MAKMKPKVQIWTVVRERDCEDSSRGKMCGDWVFDDRCEVSRGLVGLRKLGSGLTFLVFSRKSQWQL